MDKKTVNGWVWLSIGLIILSALGGYYFGRLMGGEAVGGQVSLASEQWVREKTILLPETTSTDTHALTGGGWRMYLNGRGGIAYADSTDGKTFSAPVATGITEDKGSFISNPAVEQLSDNDWIMIYEQQPTPVKGAAKNTPPGSATQRNLYVATSTDGKTFKKVGLAIDSSKEDNYFASVPDLVKLPDGKIRMYYVSGGNAVGSAISTDQGHTWVKEAGYRLDEAVDPNVLTQTKNGQTKWVMYYSVLDPNPNNIYKATSTDGLTWVKIDGAVLTKTAGAAVVDPDVIELSPGSHQMFFGESTTSTSTNQGDTINLFYANYTGEVF